MVEDLATPENIEHWKRDSDPNLFFQMQLCRAIPSSFCRRSDRSKIFTTTRFPNIKGSSKSCSTAPDPDPVTDSIPSTVDIRGLHRFTSINAQDHHSRRYHEIGDETYGDKCVIVHLWKNHTERP